MNKSVVVICKYVKQKPVNFVIVIVGTNDLYGYGSKSSHYLIINADQDGVFYCFLYEKYLRKGQERSYVVCFESTPFLFY